MVLLAVVVSAALGFVAGRLGDRSMRDPLTLLVFLAWLASLGVLLWLTERRRGGLSP